MDGLVVVDASEAALFVELSTRGVQFSDNYFHLAVGKQATVAYDVVGEYAPDAEVLQESLSIVHLRETY